MILKRNFLKAILKVLDKYRLQMILMNSVKH
uniref:Uncharacterized protein n=1 Tax=Siphoviridae sp. ctxMM9 TaxID=2827973 RepID=A0A8S5T6E6_9CAUD|nr:MAG TPA: hypothetical protein [Siphoviridae sp. ctxMM9]